MKVIWVNKFSSTRYPNSLKAAERPKRTENCSGSHNKIIHGNQQAGLL